MWPSSCGLAVGVFSGFPWCWRQLGSHFISLRLDFQHCIKPKCYCRHGTYFSYRHGTSQCWYCKMLSLNSKFTVYEVFCNNTIFVDFFLFFSKKCFVIAGSEAPLGSGLWPGWHTLAGTGKDRWDKSIKMESIKLASDLNNFVPTLKVL